MSYREFEGVRRVLLAQRLTRWGIPARIAFFVACHWPKPLLPLSAPPL